MTRDWQCSLPRWGIHKCLTKVEVGHGAHQSYIQELGLLGGQRPQGTHHEADGEAARLMAEARTKREKLGSPQRLGDPEHLPLSATTSVPLQLASGQGSSPPTSTPGAGEGFAAAGDLIPWGPAAALCTHTPGSRPAGHSYTGTRGRGTSQISICKWRVPRVRVNGVGVPGGGSGSAGLRGWTSSGRSAVAAVGAPARRRCFI